MNLLMTIAVLGAAAIGQWSEAAAVAFLFSVAELLESFSVARARRAIGSLLNLAPPTAWLKDDGALRETPVHQVPVGGIVAVEASKRKNRPKNNQQNGVWGINLGKGKKEK